MSIEMDRESNWDICPVCREHLWNLATFPGVDAMRVHHQAHGAVGGESDGSE